MSRGSTTIGLSIVVTLVLPGCVRPGQTYSDSGWRGGVYRNPAPASTNTVWRLPSVHVKRFACGTAVLLGTMLVAAPAHAIRPFITDDARVVGKGLVQLETWWRRDRLSLQHWILPAVGPTDWLELSLGAVHGFGQLGAHPDLPAYAIGGPVVQGKFLLHEAIPNKLPGVAIAVGAITPAGRGGFEAPGWSGFSYLAVTQALIKEDDFLIHANLGVSAVSADGFDPAKLTWGVGTQVETIFNIHLIGEVFSGDPYVQGSGGAYQAGTRVIFNDRLQLDATWGGGLWGDTIMPIWFSSGIRIVSRELW